MNLLFSSKYMLVVFEKCVFRIKEIDYLLDSMCFEGAFRRLCIVFLLITMLGTERSFSGQITKVHREE